jgi:hypothetical protein
MVAWLANDFLRVGLGNHNAFRNATMKLTIDELSIKYGSE